MIRDNLPPYLKDYFSEELKATEYNPNYNKNIKEKNDTSRVNSGTTSGVTSGTTSGGTTGTTSGGTSGGTSDSNISNKTEKNNEKNKKILLPLKQPFINIRPVSGIINVLNTYIPNCLSTTRAWFMSRTPTTGMPRT